MMRKETNLVYEVRLERYRRLLGGEFGRVTEAMSWSVVSSDRAPVTIDSVVRLLGGDPGDVVERGLDVDLVDDDSCLWFLEQVGDAVALMEVNGFEACRPEVLRRLSSESGLVYSAYWNIERDNTFSYAAAGEVVVWFDGEFPNKRGGTQPDALEAERVPLWASATDDGWQGAMLSLAEIRTGIELAPSWFTRPHLSLITPSLPDDPKPPPMDLFGEIIERLEQEHNPRRGAALAWLVTTLAEHFQLSDPALASAIAARRNGRKLGEATQGQIYRLRDQLSYTGTADPDTQHLDPAWRLSQAGWPS
jgi:hypothetical protein